MPITDENGRISFIKKRAKSGRRSFEKPVFDQVGRFKFTCVDFECEINNDMSSKELDQLWEEDQTEAAKLDRKIRRRKETITSTNGN